MYTKLRSFPFITSTKDFIVISAINIKPESTDDAKHDHELIRKFLAGNEKAFNEIVSKYYDKMLTTAMGLLHNRSDAEEIAQDVFIRAHRALKNFRGDSSLSTWLYRIATNLARNRYWYHFRRKHKHSVSIDVLIREDSDMTLGSCIAADSYSPSHEAIMNEFETIISDCIKKLPWKHREILELRMLEHRNYDYMAEALCLDVGTVKSRLARARGSLLSIMTADYPEFAGNDLIKLLRADKISGSVKAA